MKVLIAILVIILALVGFSFYTFIESEVDQMQDTNIYVFNNAESDHIEEGSKYEVDEPFEHRISSFKYDTISLIGSVTNKEIPYNYDFEKFYVSVFYKDGDRLIQEDFLVEDNFIKLSKKIKGDIIISLPVTNPIWNWNVTSSNMTSSDYKTYIQELKKEEDEDSETLKLGGDPYLQALYLLEPSNTGYYKLEFSFMHPSEEFDEILVNLEFEIIDK